MSSDCCLFPNCDALVSDFDASTNRLGGGAQGKVYVLTYKISGQEFACKIIKVSHSQIGRELDLVFNPIDSKYLVKFHHAFQTPDSYFLLMDYCRGGSLDSLIAPSQYGPFAKTLRLSDEDLWFIFCQLVAGLAVLHHHGIVHRDVKPENVLLVNEGKPYRIKYCDFGISKSIEETSGATCIGTHGYMAPEVLLGKYGFKCDLWSLGVLMYSLTEGKLPFDREFPNYSKLLTFSNDNQFVEIITKLLVVDPDQRMGLDDIINMPRFREAWTTYMDGEPLPSREVTPLLHSRTFSDLSDSLSTPSRGHSYSNSLLSNSDTVYISNTDTKLSNDDTFAVVSTEYTNTPKDKFVHFSPLTKKFNRNRGNTTVTQVDGQYADFPALGVRVSELSTPANEKESSFTATFIIKWRHNPMEKSHYLQKARHFASTYFNVTTFKTIKPNALSITFTLFPQNFSSTCALFNQITTFLHDAFDYQGCSLQLFICSQIFTVSMPVLMFEPVDEVAQLEKLVESTFPDLHLNTIKRTLMLRKKNYGNVSLDFLYPTCQPWESLWNRFSMFIFRTRGRDFKFLRGKIPESFVVCSTVSYSPLVPPTLKLVSALQKIVGDSGRVFCDDRLLYILSRNKFPLSSLIISSIPIERTTFSKFIDRTFDPVYDFPVAHCRAQTHIDFAKEIFPGFVTSYNIDYTQRHLDHLEQYISDSPAEAHLSIKLTLVLAQANTFHSIIMGKFIRPNQGRAPLSLSPLNVRNSFLSFDSISINSSPTLVVDCPFELNENTSLFVCSNKSKSHSCGLVNFSCYSNAGGDYLYGDYGQEASLLRCSLLSVALDPQSIPITPVTQVPTYPLCDTIVVSKNIEVFRNSDAKRTGSSLSYFNHRPFVITVFSCSLPPFPSLTSTDLLTAEYHNEDDLLKTLLVVDASFRAAISANVDHLVLSLRYFEEQGHPLSPICNILVVMQSWYGKYFRSVTLTNDVDISVWNTYFNAAQKHIISTSEVSMNDPFSSRIGSLPRCNNPKCLELKPCGIQQSGRPSNELAALLLYNPDDHKLDSSNHCGRVQQDRDGRESVASCSVASESERDYESVSPNSSHNILFHRFNFHLKFRKLRF
ncbi:hypothetical protein RCL1_001144 [Eukaryota sp. TZLM3-RCL]